MKTTHQVPAQHDIVEVMAESVMAALIMGLSLAATLAAVMMVIGA